jgi:hypothetical protein
MLSPGYDQGFDRHGTPLLECRGTGNKGGTRSDHIVDENYPFWAGRRLEDTLQVDQPLSCRQSRLIRSGGDPAEERAGGETQLGPHPSGQHFGVIETSVPQVALAARHPSDRSPRQPASDRGLAQASDQWIRRCPRSAELEVQDQLPDGSVVGPAGYGNFDVGRCR